MKLFKKAAKRKCHSAAAVEGFGFAQCHYNSKSLLQKHISKQQLYLWPTNLSLIGLKCGLLDLDMHKVWKVQLFCDVE